ncbi:hypothetical protein CK503_12505 [Aliifodinibius salipaludis]|uniref:DUF2231 domain-containing protein n=1 Tax=Fodinibius salipaludis TaxID=2032627 RepID=A0A2A2G8Q3_9BACT|nr:hypothetical protein [Aliifodinibius salipaludis]PAU93239.1 hypothetical protein CK503_12505 [Aliifodinibius salipaludis]
MEADYLHLVVNHIPIFSVGFGLLILVWGLIKKNTSILQIALTFFLIGAVSSYAAMETGEAAEDIVEELNVASHDVIHDHEEAAEIAFWFTILTGVISAVGFFALSYNIRWQNTLFGILTISALVSLGALLYTAYQGGKIFHSKNQSSSVIHLHQDEEATQQPPLIYYI